MTVDSEAIFALLHRYGCGEAALEEVEGAVAAAWIDERRPDALFLARGAARPLWIGEGRRELLFASTREALEIAERYTGVPLRKRELRAGSLLTVHGGRVVAADAFAPAREDVVEAVLPTTRARRERARCLARLAAIVAAAGVV